MRFFRPKPRSSGSLFSNDLDSFHHSLVKDLNQLDQSLSDGSISLQWSSEAINVLKKLQIEQLTLFKNYTLTIDDVWYDQYMQDTIALLDFCNSLKLAVARMSRYCMMVDLQAVSSKTIEFEKLDLCVKMMRESIRLGSRVQAKGKGKENKSITAVMLAAKRTMVVVSVLLVSAVVCPVSIELGGSDILHCRFPQLKPLVDMLSILVCRFHEKGSGSVVLEHELLRSGSVGLKEGIKKLDVAVDDVFDVVVRGRNEMLGVLRDRDLSMG